MHFKNEAEINTNSCSSAKTTTATATATSTSTSSTDSGIIIIDNNNTTSSNINVNGNGKSSSNNNNNSSYNNTKDNASNAMPNANISAQQQQQNQLPQQQPQQQQQNQSQSSTNNYTNNNYNNQPNNINIENHISIAKAGSATVNERPSYSPSMQARPSAATETSPSQSPTAQYKQTTTTATTTTTKHCSPTLSIRSTTISIVSIDENAIDSSIIDSDSDCEADAEGVHSNYIVKKLGQQTTYPPNSNDLPNINKGFKMISQQINANNAVGVGVPDGDTLAEQVLNGRLCGQNMALAQPVSSPQIGSIALTNSTDVTFGDKHFYEGPVTIQQFLIDGRDKWKATDDDNGNAGHDNPGFPHENGVNPANRAPKSAATLSPQEKPFAFILNRKAIIATSLIVLLTVLIGVIVAIATSFLDSPTTQSKDNIGGGRVLRVVPRDAWLAQPPSNAPLMQQLPVSRIIILPTQTETCTTQAACTYRVRYIQTFDIESQRHDDIVYNFLIGGDGSVYEGRGWDHVGAHLKGFNEDSISFAYIGTFRELQPAAKQMNVTELLINEGLRQHKISSNYRIYGANMLDPTSTATSADALYESFKTWPHWAAQE